MLHGDVEEDSESISSYSTIRCVHDRAHQLSLKRFRNLLPFYLNWEGRMGSVETSMVVSSLFYFQSKRYCMNKR